jgi:glycosyltransferase involved in cell wall biosynthesis
MAHENIKKYNIAHLVGNIIELDATPIRIYEMLKLNNHLYEPSVIIAMLPIKNFFNKKRDIARKKFGSIGVKIYFIPRLLLIVIPILYYFKKKYSLNAFHCHNYSAAYYALWFKLICGFKYIYDYQGAVPEEQLFIKGKTKIRLRYWYLKIIEIFILKKANYIIVVSHYAYQCYSKYNKKIEVVHCGIVPEYFWVNNIELQNIKDQLKYRKDLVIGYSGSFAPWANIELMCSFFSLMTNRFNDVRILILSKTQKNEIIDYLNKYGIQKEKYCIRNLDQSEIGKYLSVCDIGVLFRRPSFVNRVASPMKFPEYLASGVPIIINENVGDFSNLVEKESLGYLIRNDRITSELIDNIHNDLLDNRKKYRMVCRSYAKKFDLKLNVEIYKKIYDQL